MLLFSATYDDEVMKFAESVVPSPMVIRLRREEESLNNIKQYYVVCRSRGENSGPFKHVWSGVHRTVYCVLSGKYGKHCQTLSSSLELC